MKTYLPLCCFAFLCCLKLPAQNFLTTIYVEDAIGNIDSVKIGYDIDATYEIDAQFNEVDISGEPFNSTLEVRAAAYNYDLHPGCDYWREPLWNIETKEFITFYNCETSTGLYQEESAIALLIKASNLPVTVTWNPTSFAESCRDNSLLVDWMPGGWFDACCCFGNGTHKKMMENSTYVFDHTDTPAIKGQDTLFALFVTIEDDLISSTPIIETKDLIEIYPNPSADRVYINLPEDVNTASLSILDASGKRMQELLIQENASRVDISHFPAGVYHFSFVFGNQQVIKKVVRAVKP